MARDLDDYSAGDTLTAAAEVLRAEREVAAHKLELVCHWADLHAGAGSVTHDHGVLERSIAVGGEGAPEVMEFAFAELAVVLEKHPLSVRYLSGDVLDLRHRFPHLWRLVIKDLALDDWVACKIARMTRHLTKATAAVIDARIAGDTDDAATLPPSRLLGLVEALVIAADNAARDDERADGLGKRFVTVSDHKSDPGTTGVYGCVDDAGGLVLEATIADLAKKLAEAGDTDPVDVRRAKALVLLGTPALALMYQLGLVPAAGVVSTSSTTGDAPTSEGGPPGESGPTSALTSDDPDQAALAAALAGIDPAKLAPSVVLYLHLTDHTLFNPSNAADGVARWEGVGPITVDHLVDLLGHTNVTVKPVWIPTDQRASDSYEYTGNLREAVLLLRPRDVYPYAVGATRRFDIDHNDEYHDTGPPGQTRIGNAGPMGRHHHRIKTHGTIRVKQPRTGTYVWGTPHRRYRMTDGSGTHQVRQDLGDAVFGPSAGERALATALIRHEA